MRRETARRLLRAGVRLLPRGLREEHGDEIVAVALVRIERGQRGVWAEVWDLFRTGVRERIENTKARAGAVTGGWIDPMGTLIQDVRYALRMLVKTPVVSGVSILSLSLGIAATATVLALAHGFLLSPIPWPEGDEVLQVSTRNPELGVPIGGPATRDVYTRLAERDGLFGALTAYEISRANLTDGIGAPEQLQTVTTDPGFFEVLRIDPVLGRGFDAADAETGDGVVLMHGLWQRRWGGDRGVIGRTVQVDGRPRTVLGVMPEDFELIPANVSLIRVADLKRPAEGDPAAYLVLGRPAAGVPVSRIDSEVRAVQEEVAAATTEPGRYEGWIAQATPFRDTFPGPTDTRLIQILIAVSLFGLLIACANVANLLLGRAEQRQREVSLRTALGAGRGRILRQLLTESLVLAGVAGVVGVGLAVLLVDWFTLAMPPELPRSFWPRLSPLVIGSSLAVSLGAGIVFGLAPALHAVRADLRAALSGARGGTASRGRQRIRDAFVIGEFAVALALLSGSAFLIQAFDRLAGSEQGFRVEGISTFSVSLQEERYPDPVALRDFETALLDELRRAPGIEAAATASSLPRSRFTGSTPFEVPGRTVATESDRPRTLWVATSPGYRELLELPLEQGRFVAPEDGPEDEPVVVVSRTLAREQFPDGGAVGARIRLDRDPAGSRARVDGRRIVGIVDDAAQARLSLTGEGEAVAYIPTAQAGTRQIFVAASVAGAGDDFGRRVREAVARIDPTLPVAELRTLEDHISTELAGPRIIALFLGAMGVIALLLAAIGIYGVMSHSVVQRTREIGIRMAMGAERSSVIGMIARNGMKLVAVGLAIGVPLSWLMLRLVQSALAEITAVVSPLPAFAAVAAGLTGIAVLACLLPAIRASWIQPVRALGSEG